MAKVKYDKKDYKNMKNEIVSICKWFDTYEDIDVALGNLYERITEENSDRAEEFDKRFDAFAVLTAKAKDIFKKKLKDGTLFTANITFFDNAPKKLIPGINLFCKVGNVWLQRKIALYIDERCEEEQKAGL